MKFYLLTCGKNYKNGVSKNFIEPFEYFEKEIKNDSILKRLFDFKSKFFLYNQF